MPHWSPPCFYWIEYAVNCEQIVPANQLLGAVVDIVLARRREHGFDLLHVDVSLAAGCSAKKSSDDQTLDESCFDQQEA